MSLSTQRLVLAVLILIGIFGMLAASLFFSLTAQTVQIEDVLLGGFVAAFAAVVGYFFKKG